MSTVARGLPRSFVDPRSLVFWSMVGLALYGLVHTLPVLTGGLQLYPAASLLSAILWSLYVVVLMAILYRLELFERRSPLTMSGAFLWGALVVAGISVTASGAVNELLAGVLPDLDEGWVSALAAALVEEPLKMLGVVALAFIPGARITSAIDGLFFGLIVGLGFEFTESLLYTVQGASSEGGSFTMVVLTFVLRGIIGGLWNHPTFTAISGAGVGYFFGSAASRGKRWAMLLGSLLAAMALHAFFDSPVLEGRGPLVATVVKGIPVLVLFIVVYRIAQGRERRRFAATATEQVPDDLIDPDELTTLSTRRGRRQARKDVSKTSGAAAGHALKRLQRRQVDLIAAVTEDGLDADRTKELAEEVRQARDVLAEVAPT